MSESRDRGADPSAPRIPLAKLRVHWPVDTTDVPVHYCNQFALSATGHEFVLDLGQLLLSGAGGRSPQEYQVALWDTFPQGVPIEIKGRVVLSPAALVALHGLLAKSVQQLPDEVRHAGE